MRARTLARFAARVRLARLGLVAGLATFGLGAGRPAGAQSAAPRVSAPALVGPTSEDGDGAHVITIVTRDFAFEMPDTIAAGVTTFRLRNAGGEPHHLMLYRIESGRGLADVLTALRAGGAHPRWMHATGGPNAVIGTRESVGTLRLEPGRYVAFCHVNSPDQVTHFAKGMLKLVTVSPPPGPAAPLPAADLTVTLSEYGFRFSQPPTRGRHRIAVTNRGRQPHELILSKLAPGKTSADFVRWIDTQVGPPPVQPYGGVTDLPPGGTIVIDVDLEPGRYSMVCRVRDAGDDQPHDRHGMTADFVVR